MIKSIIKKLFRPLKWRYMAFKLLTPEYRTLLKEYGAINTDSDMRKYKFLIIKEVHVIEKGLSLKDCRPGFGVPKVISILDMLSDYYDKYKDQEMLVFTLSIIKRYMEFNEAENALDANIKAMYQKLEPKVQSWEANKNLCGGEVYLTKEENQKAIDILYFDFVKSRHSVRTFTNESVSRDLLEKALEIASYTPSACNRQPWGAHVFTQKQNIIDILDIKTGARQFKDMVGAIIIVTSTRKAFFADENNQWYINGGMYSMSLMYALHSVGLGCIPLNLGIPEDRLKKIWKLGNIASDEAPIVLLAVGHLPDAFKAAQSCRFPISDYTTFD